MKKHIIFSCIILTISFSCTKYATFQVKHQKFKGDYFFEDTIHISNVILCSSYQKGAGANLEYNAIDNDSVFNIFSTSLRKLPLNIEINTEISFYCDMFLHFYNKQLYISEINEEVILKLASKRPNGISMVPFIYLHQNDYNYVVVTASGGADSGSKRGYKAGIALFLVKQDQIIYSRMFNFYASSGDFYSDGSVEPSTIKQKHWDKLVKRTMLDYLKQAQ
jgi:hypothetical protein